MGFTIIYATNGHKGTPYIILNLKEEVVKITLNAVRLTPNIFLTFSTYGRVLEMEFQFLCRFILGIGGSTSLMSFQFFLCSASACSRDTGFQRHIYGNHGGFEPPSLDLLAY